MLAGMCPTGSYVNDISLETDGTIRVTEVSFTCDDPESTIITLTTFMNSASSYDYDDSSSSPTVSVSFWPTSSIFSLWLALKASAVERLYARLMLSPAGESHLT